MGITGPRVIQKLQSALRGEGVNHPPPNILKFNFITFIIVVIIVGGWVLLILCGNGSRGSLICDKTLHLKGKGSKTVELFVT